MINNIANNMTGLPGLSSIIPNESNELKMEELTEATKPNDIWHILQQIVMDQELKLIRDAVNPGDPKSSMQNILRGK